jgi:DNA-binding NarL/FixJ family response regulator
MISVLLADDQDLVREGLRMIIDADPDLTVVGEARNGVEAITRTRELDPDVVLMDIRMPDLDGIEATRRLVAANVRSRIVVLTTFDLDEYVYRAMTAGATGFLLKDATREQLTSAVRTATSGDAMLAPAVTRRLIEEFCRRPPPDVDAPSAVDQLSQRERDVLMLVARGMSNSEIASQLFLGETTVKSHLARVFTKLDLRDRVQAVVFAYETGLVRPGHPNAHLP